MNEAQAVTPNEAQPLTPFVEYKTNLNESPPVTARRASELTPITAKAKATFDLSEEKE